MSSRNSSDHQRGTVLPVLPLVVAITLGVAFIGAMMAAMAFWSGDHMGMMRRGSAGADQTPVVSDASQATIEMRDFEFFPATLTVDAGTEITWVNRDSVPHNAVAVGDSFDSERLDLDDAFSAVLEEPGTYRYVCTYHNGMEGTITVR